MSRKPTADEKDKITKLISNNKSMFRNANIMREYFYVITDTTDMAPKYGTNQYIAVLPTDNPGSVEWVNPSGDNRDDWHWGHSTIILTNKDITKVYKVRGSNSAEDKPGNRKHSRNRKTNRKDESRAERREDSRGSRDVELRRKVDEAHRESEKYHRESEGSRRAADRDIAERASHYSVQKTHTDMPVIRSRSARIKELFKVDAAKPLKTVISRVNLVMAIGVLASLILGATFGPLVTILSPAVTTFVAIGTGAFLGKRTKTVWNPDEYNWVPDKLLDALEDNETRDGAIERMSDIKLIVESGASDEKKSSSIERVLVSIKAGEAPEKDTTAGDFLADKIADMWDE